MAKLQVISTYSELHSWETEALRAFGKLNPEKSLNLGLLEINSAGDRIITASTSDGSSEELLSLRNGIVDYLSVHYSQVVKAIEFAESTTLSRYTVRQNSLYPDMMVIQRLD